MKSVSLRVEGKVQGVCYRAVAVAMAEKLRLAGWVKNERDGSVSIHAQGSDEAIDELIRWAWKGSDSSEVKQVTVTDVDTQPVRTFEVHY